MGFHLKIEWIRKGIEWDVYVKYVTMGFRICHYQVTWDLHGIYGVWSSYGNLCHGYRNPHKFTDDHPPIDPNSPMFW